MLKAPVAVILHALVITSLSVAVGGCSRAEESRPTEQTEAPQPDAVPADDEPGGPRDVVRTYYELLRGDDPAKAAELLEIPPALLEKLRNASAEEKQMTLLILAMATAREELSHGLATTDIAPADISGDSATVTVTLSSETGETATLVKILHRMDDEWKIFIPGSEDLPATLTAVPVAVPQPEPPPAQAP